MTTPIDRAADAVFDVLAEYLHFEDGAPAEALARAALASTHEPTPAMIEAGDSCINLHDGEEHAEAGEIWRAMHDAMMKETK